MPRALRTAPLLLMLWWVLSGGTADSWGVGLVAIGLTLAATMLAARAAKLDGGGTARLHWLATPSFAGFFLWRSLLAGVDVARRTLSPTPRLSPAFVELPTRLPVGAPQVMLIATLSLLPGTLGVDLTPGAVVLHVLDDRADLESDVRRAERRIGALFGLTLT